MGFGAAGKTGVRALSPEVFAAFEQMTGGCAAGLAVLEVGATPTPDTLLNLPTMRSARSRVGLNIDGPHDCGRFEIIAGQANAMTMFEDSCFDLVLCNSMLEHDPFFWRTLEEIRRVTRTGGHFFVGVPGYDRMGSLVGARRGRLPNELKWLEAAAPTLGIHNHPGDYYRFSRQAIATVVLEGYSQVEIRTVMLPPRFIAHGVRL
jgi:SAM-dependent methyltransferase